MMRISTIKVVVVWLILSLYGAMTHAGSVTYVYTDAQGTPLAEADANGNITATFDYRPYGVQALGMSPNGPGYTGHVNDHDTGLVYMQARYYDPEVGRFLSVDPLEVAAADIFLLNRYSYGKNNPVRYIDPDGRQSYEGYGSTLKIKGACQQANNCQSMEQARAMMRADGKDFIKFQAGIALSSAGFVPMVSPAQAVLRTVRISSKEVGRQVFCVLSLTCPSSHPADNIRRFEPDSSYVERQRQLDEIRERAIDMEVNRQRRQVQEPPSKPPKQGTLLQARGSYRPPPNDNPDLIRPEKFP